MTPLHHTPISARAAINTLLLLVSTAAYSQTAEPQKDNKFLDPLVVIGNASETAEEISEKKLAGSYDIITRDELGYEHPDDTLELFSKIAGVSLSRFNQGIINTDVTIRGFAGDGSSPHAKLLIDGIPSNLHNGYGELDQMFPSAMDGLAVYKGTSDVRYGLYNIAGNYNVRSRSNGGGEFQLTYGSYDAREVQGYWGTKTGNLTHSYFLGHRQSDGYRDHTDLTKRAFSGRWFYDFDEDTSLGLIMRYADYEGDSPGYLDATQARLKPRSSGSYASQDGGEKSNYHTSLHFEKSLMDDSIQWSMKAYHQNFERERWVRFNQAASLQNRYDDETQVGLIHTLNWHIDDFWTLQSGIDYQETNVLEQRYSAVNQQRIRKASTRNFDYELDQLGGFLSLENTPHEMVRWNMGIRADKLRGDFVSISPVGVETPRDIYDFGWILQPKANLFVMLNEQATLFSNIGRSFQHPFGAALYTTGDTQDRDVSINDGWEIGAKYQPVERVDLRASYWQQIASDEFINVNGNSINVGETKRSGIDLGASWNVTDKTSLWSNYSHNFTEISKTSSAQNATTGNDLRSISDYTYSVGFSHKITEKLTARLHLDGQGGYHINELNVGGTFGGYSLANAGIDYDTDYGRFSLGVNNLFDRSYEYVFDLGSSANSNDVIFSPGDGINGSISYTYQF
jgi:iron complex outermembrane receptor protein